MNIALIGASGAGKGTQAELLETKYNLVHLSSGDLFQENVKEQTALGILAKRYMEQGELVPDEVVEAMIESRLRKLDPRQSILFDGFPRTAYQAEFLNDLLSGLGRSLDAVFYLRVSREEIVKRLAGRLICRECSAPFHERFNPFDTCRRQKCHGEYLYRREDDTPAVAETRITVFNRKAAFLIDYYQKSDKLIIIDGDPDIETVNNELVDAIESLPEEEQTAAGQRAGIQAIRAESPVLSREEAIDKRLDLILFGAPGSGKGTQAETLSREFNLVHISTGDMFRENLRNETELGKLAKKYMDRGELVPDDVTQAMVRERLSRPDARAGYLLDGFPRTLPQAETLTDIVTGANRRIDGVIYIRVSDNEIIARLTGRIICRECGIPFHKQFKPFKTCPHNKCEGEYLYQRDDDNPETVGARLKTFHRQTTPLIDYYKNLGLLVEVDGEGELASVRERVTTAIRQLL